MYPIFDKIISLFIDFWIVVIGIILAICVLVAVVLFIWIIYRITIYPISNLIASIIEGREVKRNKETRME